jgi:UDP-sulfoquinovose synthase
MKQRLLILGGEGYLGWSLGLAFANRTDFEVILADNGIKKTWEKNLNIKPLIDSLPIEKRIYAYQNLFGKENLFFEKIDVRDYEAVCRLIQKHQPTIIINAAQQPSAPFSMISPDFARTTFDNNLTTNLNVVWAIAQINPEILYLKLGSAGCYQGTDADFIPENKANLQNEALNVRNTWLPMQASDFYHQSKIYSFLMSDLCCEMWKLKVITVQQSTIFGHTIAENAEISHYNLATRYNYDAIFGTVINRFVCQMAINHSLTVYGDGAQKTGVISLEDCVNHFLHLANSQISSGTHKVVHNYTHSLSIKEIAEALGKIADVNIEYLDNPRVEKNNEHHKTLEMPSFFANKDNSYAKLLQDLEELYRYTCYYKENICEEQIYPKVKWDIRKERISAVIY